MRLSSRHFSPLKVKLFFLNHRLHLMESRESVLIRKNHRYRMLYIGRLIGPENSKREKHVILYHRAQKRGQEVW